MAFLTHPRLFSAPCRSVFPQLNRKKRYYYGRKSVEAVISAQNAGEKAVFRSLCPSVDGPSEKCVDLKEKKWYNY
jgi:hypothetical protein